MVWYGPQVQQRVRGDVGRRLDMAGRALRDFARVKVGRTQPVRIAQTAKRSRTGLDPSEPGEYPKKVTAHLRRNIQSQFDRMKLEARVGTNVLYGKYLELGTKRGLRRRPWLSRALREAQGIIRSILSGGGSAGAGAGGGG